MIYNKNDNHFLLKKDWQCMQLNLNKTMSDADVYRGHDFFFFDLYWQK